MTNVEESSSGFTRATNASTRSWEHYHSPQESDNRRLPEPLTVELLNKLQVPPACHLRLLTLKTQDELLSCPGIPDDILLRLDQYLFDLPLVQIEQQPDLILANPDDLLRYKEGELLSFLLKLSPEQEKKDNSSPTSSKRPASIDVSPTGHAPCSVPANAPAKLSPTPYVPRVSRPPS